MTSFLCLSDRLSHVLHGPPIPIFFRRPHFQGKAISLPPSRSEQSFDEAGALLSLSFSLRKLWRPLKNSLFRVFFRDSFPVQEFEHPHFFLRSNGATCRTFIAFFPSQTILILAFIHFAPTSHRGLAGLPFSPLRFALYCVCQMIRGCAPQLSLRP